MGGGGPGAGMSKEKMKEEETKIEHKISKHINDMDDELKDRFKAMKTI